MGYKVLYILLEGDDDVRFFERILNPILAKNYDLIRPYKWANTKKEKVNKFLKSIKSMKEKGIADYIFLTDINSRPCVTSKKEERLKVHNQLDMDKIIVVIKEIESWYLAGLNAGSSEKLDIRHYVQTDSMTKEQFESLVPKKYEKTDFMIEILKPENFSLEVALQKNDSFKYFFDNYSGLNN